MSVTYNSQVIIDRAWPDLKKVIDGTEKALPLQYEASQGGYEVFAFDLGISYRTFLYADGYEPIGWTAQQATDNETYRTDFEDNWQSVSNSQIHDTRADTAYRRRLIVDEGGDILGTEANPFVTSSVATGTASTGATRVSPLQQIFASAQPFDKDNLLFDESLTGGATSTFNANQALVDMTVTTASGDAAIRQSRYYIPHPAGSSIVAFMRAVFGSAATNVTKRIGLFDDDNGFFVEQTSSGVRVTRRSKVTGSVVDVSVEQASWNLDPLDGTGASGHTLDIANINTLVVDLSSGVCRMGFILGGTIVNCHEFIIDNVLTLPGTAARALPIRFSIRNTDTSAGATLKQVSATAYGDFDLREFGIIASAGTNFDTSTMPAGSDSPLVSVRLKSTHARGLLYPVFFDLYTTQSRNLRARIVVGGTISGGSWSSVSTAAEANTTATSLTGGNTIWTSYLDSDVSGKSEHIQPSVLVSSNISGTPEPLTLMVGSVSSTAAVGGGLNWREIA